MEEEIREKVVTETVETISIPEQKPQITIETPQQEVQLNVKKWHEIFSDFFIKIGMIETNRALLMELIVLSTNNEKQIPNHIDWLLKELTALKSRIGDSSSSESAKRKIEPEKNGEGSLAKKVQILMNPQEVQIRTTNSELEQRIDNFIQLKKSEINNSNRAEFLRKSTNPLDPNDEQSCARSDAAEINRNIQMKLDVVNYEDGPLARSTFTSTNHNRSDSIKRSLAELPRGVEERFQNIEKHLDIVTPVPLSVYERLKALEDKIMQLERDYPTWSAIHFNQPNRQYSTPVMTMMQTPINNPPSSVVTSTFSVTPTTQTYPSIDVKRTSPSLVSTNLYNSKNPRIAPRPIKPKGRGRGQSSLTRSVMEQLKLINRTDNEKQNDNNGTFTPILTKPSNETSKSQIQILPQSTPQLSIQQRAPQVQIQPQLRPQIIQPSVNKSSVTPIPIAPKPSVQQQQKKIIAEEIMASKVSIIREDRSASPIIDPGSNNETVSKEDNMMEMDVESNEVKKSHDISGEDESSIVIENDDLSTNSTNTEITLINGNVTNDINGTDATDLVSNTNENKELEQIKN
ncbi:8513_t:CDS:2 [Rhizophagus irregularis]|nr:8513_t:CDS:2 [Rhizophagus irregularis]